MSAPVEACPKLEQDMMDLMRRIFVPPFQQE
jgi:hypothetical protein